MANDSVEAVLKITGDSANFLTEVGKAKTAGEGLAADLGKGFLSAGKAVFAAFTAIAGGAALAVKSYREQEKQEQKIRQAIESNGRAAGIAADQVFKIANAYQKTTTFADDAILSAQATLLTFDKIAGDSLGRVTGAVLDLGVKMDGDLTSAAKALGKALQDPKNNLEALTKQGIVFSEGQKRTIQTLVDQNKVSEAQNVILGRVESTAKGLAEAVAQGTGSFEQLKNASNDLLDEIGRQLAPEVVLLSTHLRDLAIGAQENTDELFLMKVTAISVFTAIKGYADGTFDLIGNLAIRIGEAYDFLQRGEFSNFFNAISQGVKQALADFKRIPGDVNAAIDKTFDDAVTRETAFKAAQEKAAKIKGVVRATTQEISKEQAAFLAELKKLREQQSQLQFEKDLSDAEFSKKVALQTGIELLSIEQKNREQQIRLREFSDEQNLIFQADYQAKTLEMQAEFRKTVSESKLTDDQIIQQLEIDHQTKLQEIRNQNRATELAKENGYLQTRGLIDEQTRLQLIARNDAFGKAMIKLDTTFGDARLDIVNQGFDTAQKALLAFGVKNTTAAKAIQVTQIAISTAANAALAYSKGAADPSFQGLSSIVLGGVMAGLVVANGAIAIAQVLSKNFNPGGLATGFTGAGQTERFMSTFSPKEIVIPEAFSQGIRRGDLTLSGGGGEAKRAAAPRVNLTIDVSPDAQKILQIQENENQALGTRVNTF